MSECETAMVSFKVTLPSTMVFQCCLTLSAKVNPLQYDSTINQSCSCMKTIKINKKTKQIKNKNK